MFLFLLMFAFAVLLILKIYPATVRSGEDSRDSSLEGVCAGDEGYVRWLQKGNKPATGGVKSSDAGPRSRCSHLGMLSSHCSSCFAVL
jgi:hypothetical protein